MKRSCYKGNEKEARALNTYVKLMRAAESVTGRIHRHLADARLSVSQFGVLEALFHLGPLTQCDIGRKILKSTGNITMIIDNLEKNGLVTRERDTRDRRYFNVNLTQKGYSLIKSIFPLHAKIIVEEFSILDKSEQKELGRICRKLGLKEKEVQG